MIKQLHVLHNLNLLVFNESEIIDKLEFQWFKLEFLPEEQGKLMCL